MTHRIGVIGGDGIGPEVIAEAIKVVDATGIDYERTDYDLGAHRYLEDGTILPDEILEEWRSLDAILLGAVGDPAVGVSAPERVPAEILADHIATRFHLMNLVLGARRHLGLPDLPAVAVPTRDGE